MNPMSRWLPADTHAGLLRRLAIVWAVALLIALAQWLGKTDNPALDRSLVYSYAISTGVWFFSDPVRISLRRWLHTEPPHYWALNPRSLAWLFAAIVLGYALGTTLGDLYAGVSTWALLTQSPQRFWNFWFSSLGISFGFLFFFYQREKSQALQRQATEAQLRLLETQLEPHMLFNTLATLRALITTDAPRAVLMLDRLNDYLRATLRASRSNGALQAHTLQNEFDRLRDYLELMAIRMGPRLRFVLELPEAMARHPLPPLLLQPLVENAIRHGLEPHVAGGEICVSAQASGGDLLLTVSDSGAGCDGAPLTGFGLAQVRQRLATAFGGADRLIWHSAAGQGTRIVLRLPLQPDQTQGLR
jgi:signal transduction histidine kinase